MDKAILKVNAETGSISLKQIFRNFILLPIKSGLFGFLTFISILIATKYFSYLVGVDANFTIEIDDVYLSLIGFVLLFLIRFLENFKPQGIKDSYPKETKTDETENRPKRKASNF
ncbi:MAG: hypothetical protein V1720_05650 [bacterium]